MCVVQLLCSQVMSHRYYTRKRYANAHTSLVNLRVKNYMPFMVYLEGLCDQEPTTIYKQLVHTNMEYCFVLPGGIEVGGISKAVGLITKLNT